MTIRLKHPDPHDYDGEKWDYCVKCGATYRLYPSCMLTRYQGKLYCDTHMSTKGHEFSDDYVIEIDEGDRGEQID